MPLPGGAAEKFGNRYEGRWTVACLLDVMDERADSIWLEPPEPEGQGFEFWFTKQGIREYHQVKRQHSTGHWTHAQSKITFGRGDNSKVIFAGTLTSPLSTTTSTVVSAKV